MIDTYQMRRPSLIGTQWRQPGEPVPEAHLWRLIEGMVRSGRLRQVQMPEAEFASAVSEHCPDSAEEIYAKLGLGALEVPNVKIRGRSRSTRTILTTQPVAIEPAAGA